MYLVAFPAGTTLLESILVNAARWLLDSIFTYSLPLQHSGQPNDQCNNPCSHDCYLSLHQEKLKLTQLREAEKVAIEKAKRDQERQEANKRAMDRLDIPGQLTAVFANLDHGKCNHQLLPLLNSVLFPLDQV